MSDFTSNFEVLEEAIGFSLVPENTDKIRDIGFEPIARAANMLHDHVYSDYFEMPLVEDEPVGICSQTGDLGVKLGGYDWDSIQGTSGEELRSNIYFSLLTNARLALPDGLQYILDYFKSANSPPEGHEFLIPSIRKYLKLYADLNELFRAGQLFILPAKVNDEYCHACSRMRDKQFIVELSATSLVRECPSDRELSDSEIAALKQKYGEISNFNPHALIGARLVSASETMRGVLATLAMSGSFGYRPIMYGGLEEVIFDTLVKTRAASRGDATPGIYMPESSVLLPHLGSLPPNEFVALKASGDAETVVRRLAEIERKAQSMKDQPLSMREMIEYELNAASKEMDKTVTSSQVLSEASKEYFKATIGFAMTSIVSLTLNPEWISDPIRLMAFGAAGATAGVAAGLAQKHMEAQKTKAAAKAFLKIKDSFTDS